MSNEKLILKVTPSKAPTAIGIGERRKLVAPCPKCGDMVQITWDGSRPDPDHPEEAEIRSLILHTNDLEEVYDITFRCPACRFTTSL